MMAHQCHSGTVKKKSSVNAAGTAEQQKMIKAHTKHKISCEKF